MSTCDRQEVFSELVKYIQDKRLDKFKELIEYKPFMLYEKNAKGYFLFQVTCLIGNSDFIKYMFEKDENLLKLIDAKVSFISNFYFFFNF